MSNVIDINGKTTLNIPVDKILEGAQNLDVAIVIGWRGDDFYMATSNADVAANNVLLDLAKRLSIDTILCE